MAERGSEQLDVVIIGAGPAGISAGVRAAEHGMRHVVLDAVRLANTIALYQTGKLVMDEPGDLPLRPEIAPWFQRSNREQVLEAWQRWVEHANVNVQAGPSCAVQGIAHNSDGFRVTLANDPHLTCRHVVVATGAGNLRTFESPGAERSYVRYQLDDPDRYRAQTIAIVGAGDSAIENALALADHNDVVLVTRRPGFERARDANAEAIQNAISRGVITHYSQNEVHRFEEGALLLTGDLRLEVDWVIGRLGATPSRTLLQDLGVEFPADEKAFPELSACYETNVPGLHLVGAAAGYPLIKQCLNQGFEVIEHIRGAAVRPADEDLLAAKLTLVPAPGTVAEKIAWIEERAPLLSPLSLLQKRQFLAASNLLPMQAGDVVFARNAFSDDLYLILSGTVEFHGTGLDLHSRSAMRREEPPRSADAGDFFGEIGLISGRRTSADAVARSDCLLVRAPRKLMVATLKEVDAVRERIDRTFIRRRLQDLIGVEIRSAELDELTRCCELMKFKQGEAVFQQGDEPNGVHLIRSGSVMISIKGKERDTVVAYLPAGNLIGEMSLLDPTKKHSGTARAMVDTETVRIPAQNLTPMLAAYPQMRARLEALESERLIANVQRTFEDKSTDVLDFLRRVGAGEATNILLIDESLCVRCDNCERACGQTHGGVSRLDRAAGPTFASIHVPTSCRHCENAKCMIDCPPDALVRLPTGEIHIKDNCIGCGNCATNCPYHVIQMAERAPEPRSLLERLAFWKRDGDASGGGHSSVAVKCDLCRELPGIDRGGHTACVAACPTGALVRVDPTAYASKILEPPA